jgi:omega-amidase
MENLKITIIQPDIVWENPKANLDKYSKWLEKVGETDVIVLPEMFTTGFSMETELFKEQMNGSTVNWMKKIATEKNVAIVGSLIIQDNGNIYNRAVWVFPDGKIAKYDKHQLFTMGQEHKNYSAGNTKTIIEYKGWRLCPMICYDLRFPVWNRNDNDYDVILFMANWPSGRHHHWKSLLVARAIENMSYCFGVNRVGTDGKGLTYLGDSGMITPMGIADYLGDRENVKTYNISKSELLKYRNDFPFLKDRDNFQIL